MSNLKLIEEIKEKRKTFEQHSLCPNIVPRTIENIWTVWVSNHVCHDLEEKKICIKAEFSSPKKKLSCN